MSRIVARETFFKSVFSFIFTHEKDDLILENLKDNLSLSEDDKNYIQNSYLGVIYNYDEIIKIIEPRLKGFTLDRIEKVNLAALIVGVYDIKYNKLKPEEIISPVVDLVKKYGDDIDHKSCGFVNAVLRNMVRDNII